MFNLEYFICGANLHFCSLFKLRFKTQKFQLNEIRNEIKTVQRRGRNPEFGFEEQLQIISPKIMNRQVYRSFAQVDSVGNSLADL